MSVEHITLNGLAAVKLTHPSGATATVYVYGAHVASWKSADGHENMFVSSKTVFGDGKAIRGGVPVCFPQFAARGAYQKHGFCRNSAEWTVVRTSTEPYPCVVLGLTDSPATKELWPFAFKLRYSVTLDSDASLSMSLAVMNSGDQPIEFTTALHTYLACAAVGGVTVHGLSGLKYDDSVAGVEAAVQDGAPLALKGEVDRIYWETPRSLHVVEGERSIRMLKMGFPDAVVWNIGEAKASTLADLGSDEWKKYICLEAAAIGRPVVLVPNASWNGGQTLTVMPAKAALDESEKAAAEGSKASASEAAAAPPKVAKEAAMSNEKEAPAAEKKSGKPSPDEIEKMKAEKAAKPKEEEKLKAVKVEPSADDKAAKEAAKAKEKVLKTVIKEGGKKGVEIEGAAEMGGLDFFCTTIESPEGDQALLLTAMQAMNADPDPLAEERKGCSGFVGKMIFSAGTTQLAIVAYVPKPESNKSSSKVEVTQWIEAVCAAVDGTVTNSKSDAPPQFINEGKPFECPHGGHFAEAVVVSNPEAGKYAIKDKDTAMAAAFAFLREHGAFPEDTGDDDDDMVFGDDDDLSAFE